MHKKVRRALRKARDEQRITEERLRDYFYVPEETITALEESYARTLSIPGLEKLLAWETNCAFLQEAGCDEDFIEAFGKHLKALYEDRFTRMVLDDVVTCLLFKIREIQMGFQYLEETESGKLFKVDDIRALIDTCGKLAVHEAAQRKKGRPVRRTPKLRVVSTR